MKLSEMSSTGEMATGEPPTSVPDGMMHPDIIYDHGKATCVFIYTKNHKLHVADHHYSTHGGMLRRYNYDTGQKEYDRELISDLGWRETGTKLYDKAKEGRDTITMDGLAGRVGYPDRTGRSPLIVAVWPSPRTDDLLWPCLWALLNQGHIQPDTLVYSTHTDGEPVQEVLSWDTGQYDPDRERKLQLARELHLMRGDKKQAAMKELGVGARGEHPMAAALNKHKLLQPGQKWWALNSESVVREQQYRSDYYIDPDNVMQHAQDKTTFIFVPPDQLFYNQGQGTHGKLIKDEPLLRAALGLDLQQARKIEYLPKPLLSKGLFGRLGTSPELGQQIASFWNSPPDMYAQLIRPCLQALLAQGLIAPETMVHYPTQYDIPVARVLTGRAVNDDPEALRRAELARRLHLLRGAEKQAAMKELGLGAGGQAHPVSRALDRAGLRRPGQKWWAMQSEGVD